jgi:hypothetical protein
VLGEVLERCRRCADRRQAAVLERELRQRRSEGVVMRR